MSHSRKDCNAQRTSAKERQFMKSITKKKLESLIKKAGGAIGISCSF